MTPQQLHVHAVCFPRHVEHVTNDGKNPDADIHSQIPKHPGDQPPWRAQLSGLPNQPKRDPSADQIADYRHHPDHRIQSELNIGTGNLELTVHQFGNLLQLLQLLMPNGVSNQFGFEGA
jgi:hypothetical protein